MLLGIALLVMVPAADLAADLKSDVGYTQLTAELGAAMPTGADVMITQVEAPDAGGFWMPDSANVQFTGKTITNKTGGLTGLSSHATAVGTYLYGNTGSLSPGVTAIDVYAASTSASSYYWIGLGYLMQGVTVGGYPIQPMYLYSANASQRILAAPSRVGNHSWVGSSNYNGAILRRMDFSVAADEFIQIVAVNNGTVQNHLFSGMFNALTVGRTDGGHPTGTLAIDSVYTAGRVCPLIVSPLSVTSATAPNVASAAALLVQTGRDTDLAVDPQQTYTTDRSGRVIVNAERSETIKAALLAGAQRMTYNSLTPQIRDYRRDPAHRGSNGMDIRFGAGQLDIFTGYHIIEAGEQNNAEDAPANNGAIDSQGFDLDPYFGGLSGSKSTGTYRFTAAQGHRRLYASLVWNLKIAGGTWNNWVDTATLYDLNLALYDTTPGGADRLVAASSDTQNNTENLWAALVPGRSYRLEVSRPATQTAFLWDYALAWRMAAPADSDGDGMDDEWEVEFGLAYDDPADGVLDGDADDLNAAQEYLHGTGPAIADSDGDGVNDGPEVAAGSDPLDPDSLPGPTVPVGWGAGLGAGLLMLGIGRHYHSRT
jgi:hypothetical protein